MENYNRRIGKTKDEKQQEVYESNVLSLRSEVRDLAKRQAEILNDLQNAERDANSVQQWQSGLLALKEALSNGDKEIRPRLNDHLREFIDRIEVFAKGLPAQFDGDDFSDYFCEILTEHTHGPLPRLGKRQRDEHSKFVRWVRAQQRTKAGRFLRVHWKMSDARRQEMRKAWGDDYRGYFDLIPEDSIAGHPDIQPLWDQFRSKKNRGAY
jgi:hypothetical protein